MQPFGIFNNNPLTESVRNPFEKPYTDYSFSHSSKPKESDFNKLLDNALSRKEYDKPVEIEKNQNRNETKAFEVQNEKNPGTLKKAEDSQPTKSTKSENNVAEADGKNANDSKIKEELVSEKNDKKNHVKIHPKKQQTTGITEIEHAAQFMTKETLEKTGIPEKTENKKPAKPKTVAQGKNKPVELKAVKESKQPEKQATALLSKSPELESAHQEKKNPVIDNLIPDYLKKSNRNQKTESTLSSKPEKAETFAIHNIARHDFNLETKDKKNKKQRVESQEAKPGSLKTGVSRETIDLKNSVHFRESKASTGIIKENMVKATVKEDGDKPSTFTFNHSFESSSRIIQKESLAPEARQHVQQQASQLMQRARVMIHNKENANLTTQLYPKELGKITVNLALIEGVLHGKITVENEMVQKELLGQIEKLVQELKDQGLEVQKFTVDVGSDSSLAEKGNPDKENSSRRIFSDHIKSNLNNYHSLSSPVSEGQYA